jgi:Zn finger protein HypA/HybF involved in hydrogenase expression
MGEFMLFLIFFVLFVIFIIYPMRVVYCQSCGYFASKKKIKKLGGVCPNCGGMRFGTRKPPHVN